VLEVLQAWGIAPEDQCRLLGMGAVTSPRQLRRYRLGAPLPDEAGTWVRVGLLLDLNDALRQVFPHSGASADLWVTTPRAKLGHRAPLDLMLAGGIDGIRQVERSLDNAGLI
jgi:uncharacterized protein (DUF2384 family)